jgi:hypothetical protein
METLGAILRKLHEPVFSFRRPRHQSSPKVWIYPQNGGLLREAYATPNVWEKALKPGYYWAELVH